ncbi:SGNH/GDSL hydrolase family protein [Jeotgalibacillus aurantiacus]|uniref:SGNH/GDSL hydrolase family protein n=1 Tax=Jeotgalibacillus aurantiacus TaxID=2763266 RepID=UPI001D09CBF5|nr:SGNH/GDSL hydrolase family protein [Jeotgalibacillus aurantiacus]
MKIALIGDSLTEGRPGVSFIKFLKETFPTVTFDNLGKPGESVKSLHSRLLKTKLDSDCDLAFVWIGVNDVYTKLLKVQAQPVTKNHEEFKDLYEEILNIVLGSSKNIVAVSPALVGETNNLANKEIKELTAIIESIVNRTANTSFVNIYSVFEERLAKVNSSDYISTKVLTVMKDVLFYKKNARIDKLSKKRGLNFTLDGIHLNSSGARIVAEIDASAIDKFFYINHSVIKE